MTTVLVMAASSSQVEVWCAVCLYHDNASHVSFPRGRSMDDESDDSLAREVTVVLATSYTAACPSTNLIEAVVRSFGFVPGLDACRLIVVCDGFRVSIRNLV